MDCSRIGKEEVAVLAAVSPQTLIKHVHHQRSCRLLQGLPEPIEVSRGSRLLWVRQDVLDWLASQRTFLPQSVELRVTGPVSQPPRKRGPGRPRKLLP